MEIYQLRYFLSVADNGSFTKAAKLSHISQPSLSQQIINLEDEIGQKLFHRLNRRTVLTDAGSLLAERARRIVAEVDGTLRELSGDPQIGHRVSVGVVQTVAHFFVPAIVAYCQANRVPIELRCSEDFRTAVVDSVIQGEIDWGLISLPISDVRLEAVPLFSEPLLLAISAQHPLARQPNVAFEDLREENFIMLGNASSLTAQVHRISLEHQFELRVVHRCAQLSTVKSLTALGLGISVLPQSARSAYDPEGLIYRKLSGPPLRREIALIRHRGRHLGKGAQLFRDAALAVVGPSGDYRAPRSPASAV